jgi:hypothetical protein
MSFLIPKPKLHAGERILWRSPAAISLRTAVGGTLYITTARLLFVPNRLNFRRNRQSHDWSLVQVAEIGVRDRDFTPYTGGMHRRLQVTLKSGEQILFVTKALDQAVREIRTAIA